MMMYCVFYDILREFMIFCNIQQYYVRVSVIASAQYLSIDSIFIHTIINDS